MKHILRFILYFCIQIVISYIGVQLISLINPYYEFYVLVLPYSSALGALFLTLLHSRKDLSVLDIIAISLITIPISIFVLYFLITLGNS